MPAIPITYDKCIGNTMNPPTISTPLGLAIIEIQGELNVPEGEPAPDADPEYLKNFVKIDNSYTAVKFGRLEFDSKEPTNAVLYISKSQRLLGKLVSLQTPLGVLKIASDRKTQMVDIIYHKLIFKDRPLPIM